MSAAKKLAPMTDCYLPALAEFAFDNDETAVIAKAMASASPWGFEPATDAEEAALQSAKKKILDYHLSRHKGTCCYCRTNLNGAGPFMTDREHILPKGKPLYKPYSFTMWNLAAACKRCNMQFKKTGDIFVIDQTDPNKFQSSDNYCFVHPNFDRWEDHLEKIAIQVNSENIVFIRRKIEGGKAEFTHEFFDLGNLEVDSFDRAQGIDGIVGDGDAAMRLRKIALYFNQ